MVETQKKTYLLLLSRAPFARTHTRKWISEKYVSLRMELLTQIPNSIFLQENQERDFFITRPFLFLTIAAKDPFSLLPKSVLKGRGPTTYVASMPQENPGGEKMPHTFWLFPLFIFLSS